MEPLTLVFIVLLILVFWVGIVWLVGRYAKWKAGSMMRIGAGIGLAIGFFKLVQIGFPSNNDEAAVAFGGLIGYPIILALFFAIVAWVRSGLIWCRCRLSSSN